jgi:hypothetical protein
MKSGTWFRPAAPVRSGLGFSTDSASEVPVDSGFVQRTWGWRKREIAFSPSKSMPSGSASGSENVDQVCPITKRLHWP